MSVPFRLSKVRLINWHNFIDETIEVDGSLFLIGDNGSGKTTLLDAIHCALTGDWKVELNAAARVGGRREEGRDLVGIVLRKDFEKGFGRPDGAIAYSALEFRRDLPGARQGACLSVGIGVYVPSAESRPEKWGFVVPRSLEEVSLTRAVERRNGSTRAERPSDRSELASHLGPGHVFDIGRYRSRLGERLYGSRDNLEQVATFLQAGKAYRELVAKTTNFSELFAGLLPLPDVETFLEVRRALDAIERTRIDLEALDEELLRLHTLIGWLGDIAEERQTVARYDYLAARFARERARETLAVLRAELERVRIDHERVSNELRDVDGRVETLGAELDRLRASQGANLLARYREQSGELSRQRLEVERHSDRHALTRKEVAAHEERWKRVVEMIPIHVEPVQRSLFEIAAVIAAQIPAEPLEQLGRLGDRVTTLAREPATAEISIGEATHERRIVRRATAERRNELRDEEREARTLAESEAALVQELESRAQELRERGEVDPPLANLDRAIERLAADGIRAVPFYRLLEPRRRLGIEGAGVVERALGRRILGTLIAADGDHARAKEILTSEFPGIPIADPSSTGGAANANVTLEQIDCDPVADLLEVPREQPAAARFLEHHAGRLAWLAEPPAEALDGDFLAASGQVHHRRLIASLSTGPAVWLGSRARERALREALEQLDREAKAASTRARDAREKARRAEATAQELARVEARLDELELLRLSELVLERNNAARDLEKAKAELEERDVELTRARSRLAELEETVRAIEEEIEKENLASLARRIEEVDAQLKSSIEAQAGLLKQHGRLEQAFEAARAREAEGALAAEALEEPFRQARRDLLGLVPPEARADLDDWVLRVKHGRQVKPENIASNRQQHTNRIAALVAQIHSSDGIRHQLLWRKYAFQHDEKANTLADSTGKDIHMLASELEAHVEELGEALRGKNEELLERIVLEELVSTLRRELRSLEETVRGVNALMGDLRFGRSRYRIEARLKPEYRKLEQLLQTSSALAAAAREDLRSYFSARLGEFTSELEGDLPSFLDYRRWFEFNLHVATLDSEGVELSRERLRQGSGGEQAVPSYLLLICLTKVLYDGIAAGARVLLLDEAFYGIDSGRRDELLRFTRRAGIELVIATPDMDGVTDALEASTTVLIEKTPSNDVYLWDMRHRMKVETLFDAPPPVESLVLGEVSEDAARGESRSESPRSPEASSSGDASETPGKDDGHDPTGDARSASS